MKQKHVIALAVFTLFFSFHFMGRAENRPGNTNENPFGSNPESPSLPPGSELQEDDNFLAPDNNFGFQAPPDPSSAMNPPPISQPPLRKTPPGPIAKPSNSPSPAQSLGNNRGNIPLTTTTPTKPSSEKRKPRQGWPII